MEDITFKAAAPSANQPSGNREFMAIAESLKNGIMVNTRRYVIIIT